MTLGRCASERQGKAAAGWSFYLLFVLRGESFQKVALRRTPNNLNTNRPHIQEQDMLQSNVASVHFYSFTTTTDFDSREGELLFAFGLPLAESPFSFTLAIVLCCQHGGLFLSTYLGSKRLGERVWAVVATAGRISSRVAKLCRRFPVGSRYNGVDRASLYPYCTAFCLNFKKLKYVKPLGLS